MKTEAGWEMESVNEIEQPLRGGTAGRFVGPVARRDGRVARATAAHGGARKRIFVLQWGDEPANLAQVCPMV